MKISEELSQINKNIEFYRKLRNVYTIIGEFQTARDFDLRVKMEEEKFNETVKYRV